MRSPFVLSVFAVSSSWAANPLSPTPIPLEIDSVNISNGQKARGVKIAVGNPPQNFAFQVQLPLNNAFVYGSPGFCSVGLVPWTHQGCATYRGGCYDADRSTTRQDEDFKLYPQDDATYPKTERFLEEIKLNNETSLPSFPLAAVKAPWATMLYHPLAAIGLGPRSTLLGTLKRSGRIASRSFGFFWGRVGRDPAKHIPGSFVLGGYDRAKITGDEHKFSFKERTTAANGAAFVCQTRMVVQIADIVMNRVNGENLSIMPADRKPVEACIIPDEATLLRLPHTPYIEKFHEFTGSQPQDFHPSLGLNFGVLRYSQTKFPQEVYGGEITVRLTTGLAIRVPNDQLILSAPDVLAKTGEIKAPPNKSEIALGEIDDMAHVQQPITLGRQFLTAAYLMANQDDDEFSLWEAKPTTAQNLISVNSINHDEGDGSEGGNDDKFCGGNADSSCGEKRSLPVGVIVAITVGSVAFVSLIGPLIWIPRRKGMVGLGKLIPHRKRQTMELPASGVGLDPNPYGARGFQQPDRVFQPYTPESIIYQPQRSPPHPQWHSPMSELAGQRSPKLHGDGYSY